jgi:hypothetical protein
MDTLLEYSQRMPNGVGLKLKRCRTCGGEYLLTFYRLRPDHKTGLSSVTAQRYYDRCIGCETAIKQRRRINKSLRRKATAARRRHGLKLEEQGIIKHWDDLEEIYGWSIDRMVDDIQRVISGGCPYCMLPLNELGQDLAAVTLDIRDPTQDPHYSANVEWCCARCNSEKQRTSLSAWGAKRSMWERWHRHQVLLEADPEKYGFLALDKEEKSFPTLW